MPWQAVTSEITCCVQCSDEENTSHPRNLTAPRLTSSKACDQTRARVATHERPCGGPDLLLRCLYASCAACLVSCHGQAVLRHVCEVIGQFPLPLPAFDGWLLMYIRANSACREGPGALFSLERLQVDGKQLRRAAGILLMMRATSCQQNLSHLSVGGASNPLQPMLNSRWGALDQIQHQEQYSHSRCKRSCARSPVDADYGPESRPCARPRAHSNVSARSSCVSDTAPRQGPATAASIEASIHEQ